MDLTNCMTFEKSEVKIATINDQPYFEVYSTGVALGYSKSNTIKGKTYTQCRKDRIEKLLKTANIQPLVHDGLIWFSEEMLYDFMLEAHTDKCKAFRKWITSEVLPSIRRTGGYIPVTAQDDDLTIMARAHQILERTIAQKDQIIQQLQPKADTYDMIMNSDGTFSMNQAAKQVGMGEYHLFAYLRGKKVLFYEGADNVPYERFRKNGCFKVIDTVSPDGKSHSTTRVTQKGLDYICKIVRKDNEGVLA